MKHLTAIGNPSPPPRPTESPPDARRPRDLDTQRRPDDVVEQPDLDAAVADLQASLDRAKGSPREASIRFEDDGAYVVEIRAKDDGRLLQEFPPENLLNRRGSPADLLGTVIDRRS